MTDKRLQTLYLQAKSWADEAHQAGWLRSADIDAINTIEARTPAELFNQTEQRPLVVAFFGGTGVGKSTLLNRLSGQQIARTGVERPTSREVSIYVHQSIEIRQLPKEFPIEKVKIALHQDAKYQDVLWVDMPDIDSIETANKTLVLEWLPHIDVLVYVVSPERYRDDQGWRLLLEHGHRHAWMFVINQWDKGQPSQREDFDRQLKEAGFQSPIILCTDSRSEDEGDPDDLDELSQTIRSLANSHTIGELEKRGVYVRLRELRDAVLQASQKFGSEESFESLKSQWHTQWDKTSLELQEGLAWQIAQAAEQFASRDANLLPRTLKQLRGKNEHTKEHETPPPPKVELNELWNDWAQTRVDDALDSLIVEAGNLAIPSSPLRPGIDNIRQTSKELIQARLRSALGTALLKPGSAFHRLFYRATSVLSTLLPLLALSWIAYRVIVGFYLSGTSPDQYLGINFTTHSVLLVATAWLLPYFAHRKLKPSIQKAALKGLQIGLMKGLAEIGQQISQEIEEFHNRKKGLVATAKDIADACSAKDIEAPRIDDAALSRMLSGHNAFMHSKHTKAG